MSGAAFALLQQVAETRAAIRIVEPDIARILTDAAAASSWWTYKETIALFGGLLGMVSPFVAMWTALKVVGRSNANNTRMHDERLAVDRATAARREAVEDARHLHDRIAAAWVEWASVVDEIHAFSVLVKIKKAHGAATMLDYIGIVRRLRTAAYRVAFDDPVVEQAKDCREHTEGMIDGVGDVVGAKPEDRSEHLKAFASATVSLARDLFDARAKTLQTHGEQLRKAPPSGGSEPHNTTSK